MMGKKKLNPYEKGRLAFIEGQLSNPYQQDSEFKEHRNWQLGFNQAYFRELNWVKEREQKNNKP
jgi:hypothetical protein